jgi:glycosyltransferase involved in cell wall biosynthesis
MRILTSHADADPPPIRPVEGTAPRPRISVMVPSLEPDERLCQTLTSVLAQAPGAAEMQICVVDDASRPGIASRLVRSVDATGRIEVVECAERLGLSGNWNRAIHLARGHFVHLLHQDDYVMPGFYARMDHGFDRTPTAGMAFCRARIVDGDDRLIKVASRLQWMPGVLGNWLPAIAERQRVQTPCAIVARAAYETVGGYRSDLHHALDWEMWVRIAACFPVWYDPRPLASYRRHEANETSRLVANGKVWPDMTRAIGLIADLIPTSLRPRVLTASTRWCAASAMRTATRQIDAGHLDAAAATLASVPEILALDGGGDAALRRRLAHLQSRIPPPARRAA